VDSVAKERQLPQKILSTKRTKISAKKKQRKQKHQAPWWCSETS